MTRKTMIPLVVLVLLSLAAVAQNRRIEHPQAIQLDIIGRVPKGEAIFLNEQAGDLFFEFPEPPKLSKTQLYNEIERLSLKMLL